MAIDMSQFHQVFFEEAAEHLGSMEAMLLSLDVALPDDEQLNAIFRAAHSIKGSAGTFGFTDLVQVTHVLENLLDQIRKGELPLRNDMVDVFLDAGDVLKQLLTGHRGGEGASPDVMDGIISRLHCLMQGPLPSAEMVGGPGTSQSVTDVAVNEMRPAGYHLRFVLDVSLGALGGLSNNLQEALAEFGTAEVLSKPLTDDGVWEMALHTAVDSEQVRDVLEYVVRSDSLRITELATKADGSVDCEDGSYGFFADEQATLGGDAQTNKDDPDGAFGFFASVAVEEVPAGTGLADDPMGAFGFFSSGEDKSPASTKDDPDGAFGFFDVALADAPVAPIPTKNNEKDDPEGSYGFFDPNVGDAQTQNIPYGSANAAVSIAGKQDKTVAARPSVMVSSVESQPAKAPMARTVTTTTDKPVDATIRVGVEKVDQLINLVGELVITQAMLTQSINGLDAGVAERLLNGLTQLERNTRDLQESVMSIRMMPMSVVFSRFPRVVRDLSQKLGKQVELKLIGETTELDKSLIERITDPLTHLVRNSLDHAIEMPDERVAKGKSRVGTITLKAYQQSGNIVIEVEDDGAGINRDKILAKARESGLNVHDGMADNEVWQLIFEPGFSTAEQVTEVSGRGVGMDVVKKNITAMGGRVEINSVFGIGTRMTVRLPLTLAILDGMSVAVGHETFILPLGYVVESLQATRGMVKSLAGIDKLVQVRDEYLPVISLHAMFNIPGAIVDLEQGIMVIIESDGAKAALFVDVLVGQHQVVIKSLESNYRKVSGVSGATIMGDGHVALILDVAALVAAARTNIPAAA